MSKTVISTFESDLTSDTIPAVDISGPIAPLESDQFVTVGATNASVRVQFSGVHGYEATDPADSDAEIGQVAVELVAGTVYKWFDVLNLALTKAYEALPATIIAVTFTSDQALNWVQPNPATANRTNTVIRAAGFTWLAGQQYTRARKG
jgi:hypothetical protein